MLVFFALVTAAAAASHTLYEIPSPLHRIECSVEGAVANCTLLLEHSTESLGVSPVNVTTATISNLAKSYREGVADLHACIDERSDFELLFLHQKLTEEAVSKIWALFGRPLPPTPKDQLVGYLRSIAFLCAAERRRVQYDRNWDVLVGGLRSRPAASPTQGDGPSVFVWVGGVVAALFFVLFGIALYRRRYVISGIPPPAVIKSSSPALAPFPAAKDD